MIYVNEILLGERTVDVLRHLASGKNRKETPTTIGLSVYRGSGATTKTSCLVMPKLRRLMKLGFVDRVDGDEGKYKALLPGRQHLRAIDTAST